TQEAGGKHEIRLRLVAAADVAVQRTEWIEPHRIPLGKFALLEGAGDLGKTTLAIGLIAAATRGEHFFPVEDSDARLYPPKARRVLVVAREDDLGILKARLVAAKAVLALVTFIDGRDLIDADGNIEEAGTSFTLPRDIEPLRRAIEETRTEIVYIDALHSHVLVEGDVKSPQDVRQTYHQIVEMVNATGVTLLATRHWGKAVGPASDRGLGSSEIGHVARAILTFAKHPEIEGRYLVAQTKKNLAKAMPAVEYRLEILDATDDAGNPWTVTRTIVEGIAEGVTADDLAMALPVDRETRTLKAEATQSILAAFSDGETITAEELDKAKKDAGGAARTWERARADLTRAHVLNRSREGTDGPVIYAIDRSRIRLFAKEPRSSPHLGIGEQRPGVANNGNARNFATAARVTAADLASDDQEPVVVAMADHDETVL
ncbi:MAG: AAA family ATPase, partial [Minisyncoccota bacterium]